MAAQGIIKGFSRQGAPGQAIASPRRWVPVRLSALSLLTAACSQNPETRKEEALARGKSHLEARQPAEAIIGFQDALQVDPQFVPALHGLARAYAARYWYLDALRELERARQFAPESVPIAVDIGRVWSRRGLQGAEAQAQSVLSREPDNREALYIKAAALIGQGKVDEDCACREPGREGFPAADLARAEALLGLNRAEQADQVVRGALARHPEDARSLAAAAVVSLARKQYAKAEEPHARARSRSRGSADPARPRAARARQGRLAEAIQELEAVSPGPERGRRRALARYYLDSRRTATPSPCSARWSASTPATGRRGSSSPWPI